MTPAVALAKALMDAFDSGSELSSVGSDEEARVDSVLVPSSSEKRKDGSENKKRPKRPRVEQEAQSDSEYESDAVVKQEKPRIKPAKQPLKRTAAPTTASKAATPNPVSNSAPKPTPKQTTPNPAHTQADGLESTAIATESQRPTPRPKPEKSFASNMSGWDQLFGPIANATPKQTDTRLKDETPEQRAAIEEQRVKERGEAQRIRDAQAKEERAREQQQKEVKEREQARQQQQVPPPPVRPAEVRTPQSNQMDLLSGSRAITGFEEDMGTERRHLRASRFGAGLHHLSKDK
ncbi:hypothetical protein MVES_003376 [Malassezia vespertilionis]|uniref:Uncharacterized protein n=1 Tax=Malassezia vespertilionis TaxID=2020962 RepID=A0A2N1J7L3_9BASI|nr:hypothetical protein MVES_003376 [Malassezia vespertilionis]